MVQPVSRNGLYRGDFVFEVSYYIHLNELLVLGLFYLRVAHICFKCVSLSFID